MSNSSKRFDPLASALFDVPEPGSDHEEVTGGHGLVPHPSSAADLPALPPEDPGEPTTGPVRVGAAADLLSSPLYAPAPAAAPVAAPPAPAPTPPAVDPVELAKQLGKMAAARAAAQAPKAAAPAPRPGPATTGKVPPPSRVAALAARVPSPQSSAPAPKPPAPKPPAPKPPEVKAPEVKPKSRLDDLATRAVRPMSAAEAMRAAAESETRAREQAAKAPPPTPPKPPAAPAQAQPRPPEAARPTQPVAAPPRPAPPAAAPTTVPAILARVLPNAGNIEVVATYPAAQPEVLKAVWKAFRGKLASEGNLERAVAASALLHALERAPAGLIAVHVRGKGGELLVWIDQASGAAIAAFPEPAVYLAGLVG